MYDFKRLVKSQDYKVVLAVFTDISGKNPRCQWSRTLTIEYAEYRNTVLIMIASSFLLCRTYQPQADENMGGMK